ncbi:hypothetical protein V5799_018531 [Amblyomma americanum]|uniref:Uncharacterized protein n=1 Tax=Amblyomma americanum TaxID=6943 RepID=A0AAQ4EZ70_AMBAM
MTETQKFGMIAPRSVQQYYCQNSAHFTSEHRDDSFRSASQDFTSVFRRSQLYRFHALRDTTVTAGSSFSKLYSRHQGSDINSARKLHGRHRILQIT